MNRIVDLLYWLGIEEYTTLLVYGLLLIIGIVLCVVFRMVIRMLAKHALKHSKSPRTQALVDSLLVKRASNIVIPVVLLVLVQDLIEQHDFVRITAEITFVILVLMIFFSCLKSVAILYDASAIAKVFPIHGIIQVITVVATIIGVIIIISILIGQSPLVLLGGLGAMTAVTTLIFKDAILGFVAGIQLTTNHMIAIGDWIELPNHYANGFVVDLTMTTVKIENFDKTIISVPAYKLISESFINWRGMMDAGGRRIKRALRIDIATVRVCDEGMLARFKGMALLENERHETNIGFFRAYITAFLRSHPQIRQDLTLMVRQLEPNENGLALEIIAFVAATAAIEYEAVQADIFDHLYAVIRDFDLCLYQAPSGNDLRRHISA